MSPFEAGKQVEEAIKLALAALPAGQRNLTKSARAGISRFSLDKKVASTSRKTVHATGRNGAGSKRRVGKAKKAPASK